MQLSKLSDFTLLLTWCFNTQTEETTTWHDNEPESIHVPTDHSQERVRQLLLHLHLMNFKLWHLEDVARADSAPESIALCKRNIDATNQRRNDAIEELDITLAHLMTSLLPENTQEKFNTETIGAALDRLSINALKIFHMQEQVLRDDTDLAHKQACEQKVATMRTQRKDLEQSILDLAEDYAHGLKKPRIYRQFKMYNDPNLNPALYANKKQK